MSIKFIALASEEVTQLQNGKPDAYGLSPERTTSDGDGNPCRHCLEHVPNGAPMLILAYCPFPAPQPYAETGPIFLCGETCQRYDENNGTPPVLPAGKNILIKGYGSDDRIKYGSGKIIDAAHIKDEASTLFTDPTIAYIHVRSATNNCYTLRIERG